MSQKIDEVLNNAPCGFLSFTDDGLIVLTNVTLAKLLGYETDSLRGKKFEIILPIASRIFYQTHFFPLLKLHGKIEEIYFSLRAKEGHDIPMLINASRRCEGEDFVYDCIFIPILQRIQYEDEILKAKKAADRSSSTGMVSIAGCWAKAKVRGAEREPGQTTAVVSPRR